MASKLRFLPLAALLLTPPLAAKPADYAPVVAAKSRSDEARKLDEGRMPAAILDFAGFKRGDVVADYQAGSGYYSELIAGVVGPRGQVIAINQTNFHDAKAWAPLLAAHPNVVPLVAAGDRHQLAPRSVDAVFAHLVYHDLYWESEKYQHPRIDVPSFAANWFAAVKPGGHVVIVDHVGPAGDPRAVVEKLHRIDPERVKADMAAAGFVLEAESAVLRRSDDGLDKNVFDPAIRGKTDRFVLKFKRP